MRFAILDKKLVPEPLLSEPQTTQTIAKLGEIPQPSRNLHFQYCHDVRKRLIGKQLLLDEIPIL